MAPSFLAAACSRDESDTSSRLRPNKDRFSLLKKPPHWLRSVVLAPSVGLIKSAIGPRGVFPAQLLLPNTLDIPRLTTNTINTTTDKP